MTSSCNSSFLCYLRVRYSSVMTLHYGLLPGKWPWQASQQRGYEHSCGASILNSYWLLTAAHCVDSGGTSSYNIVIGMHDRYYMSQGNPVRHSISRIIRHPSYANDGRRGFPNDIALIQVTQRMNLNGRYAKAIQMANSGQKFEGSSCYITGWGLTSMPGERANILQEAPAKVFSNSYCTQYFGSSAIHEFHICIGNPGVSAACSSDSGGPLACKVGNTWTLAGVTSWGVSSCSPNYPDIYTRVSYYRDWIRRYTHL